ncbi:MAG TPA: glycosyltransferase family 39 protein [Verrucomicrobiae bacterium]|nr:glycosyltransferase family 39 protein [Verrucomicrobiae bacterium]
MNGFLRQGGDRGFITVWTMALLAGLFLRFYLVADQVFSDDEWHGFYYAIGKSPMWLLTHFSIPGATCIPLNFYTWLLGACGGWSEMGLRMPSLVFGMLCVTICPLLAWKIVGPQRAAWLALLLAFSPVLVFYSRICRPYSAVAFLGFAAILLAARWMQTGGFRPALLFAVAGVLAVYFHLFAAVTVAAPVLAAMGFHLYAYCLKKRPMTGPPLRHWLLVVVGMAVVGAILILPALIGSMRGTFFTIALSGSFKLESLPRVAMLVSGTGQLVLALLFLGALIVGAVEQCRRNPWFGATLVILYPLHVLAMLLSRPDCAQSAIVLTRYCIPLVPVSLLLVACGLQAVVEFIATRLALRPVLQTVLAVACVVVLASAGPLPRCYIAPNNFTSHGAYQHNYAPIDWNLSFSSDLKPADSTLVTTIRVDEVSPFYGKLAKLSDNRAIIEYPMLIGDHFNPFYYYQHFHRHPVIVGYASDVKLARGLAAGNIYGNTYIDQILSLVEDPARLKFRNLISMDDLAAMRSRNVEYIILHKRFEAQLPVVALPLPDLERLRHEYETKLGAPAYEDANIVVFSL